ncbi:MAG TPA: helix-turn-helix transcriptional regulator [Nitrospirales bacterium]|jgi:DNA-binding CsgD family transcriptional regulator
MKESSAAKWEPLDSIADKRAGPGLLMLTASMQTLYRDRRFSELCSLLNRYYNGRAARGVLPPAVADVCAEIRQALEKRAAAPGWEDIRIKRMIGDPASPVFLYGLGVPDLNGFEHSRILLILEEVGQRVNSVTAHAKELYRLTDREVSVIKNLLKGWTNKQIANELGVTEQTVKEHIKHIMEKTKTTTRTGVLVQIARLELEQANSVLISDGPPSR